MIDEKPLITIVTPTHNRPDLLLRAVRSVLAQTYSNWELVIVDDASEEKMAEVLQDLLQQHTNIRVLRNEQSLGACATRNRGIAAAKGEYVAFLDDDDEYTPERLERLMEKLRDGGNWSFVCSDYHELRPGGPRVSRKSGLITLERVLWLNVTTPSVLTYKTYLDDVGGFDTNLVAAQDYDLFTRLIKAFGPAYRLADVLYTYHQEHLGPRITTNRSKRFRGYYDFYRKFKADMTREQRAFYLFRLLKVQGKRPSIRQYCGMVPWRFLPMEFNTFLLEETSFYLYLARIKAFFNK